MPFTDVNHRLEYAWLGPKPDAAPTIVMLHHGLGSVSAWHNFPQAVADRTGLGVLVYSRWGYGKSEPLRDVPHPVDFMDREAREDLHQLIRALAIQTPILLGHSDGASIALLYASAGLEPRPTSLILMAPHVFVEECTTSNAEAIRAAYESGELRKKLARHHNDPDGAFHGWNATWLMPEFRKWNIEAALATVHCPVTVIQGEDDEYGTAKQIHALTQGLGTEAEVVLLPDCAHLVYRDKEDESLLAIERHVRRVLETP